MKLNRDNIVSMFYVIIMALISIYVLERMLSLVTQYVIMDIIRFSRINLNLNNKIGIQLLIIISRISVSLDLPITTFITGVIFKLIIKNANKTYIYANAYLFIYSIPLLITLYKAVGDINNLPSIIGILIVLILMWISFLLGIRVYAFVVNMMVLNEIALAGL